jgi:hypothetical protein
LFFGFSVVVCSIVFRYNSWHVSLQLIEPQLGAALALEPAGGMQSLSRALSYDNNAHMTTTICIANPDEPFVPRAGTRRIALDQRSEAACDAITGLYDELGEYVNVVVCFVLFCLCSCAKHSFRSDMVAGLWLHRATAPVTRAAITVTLGCCLPVRCCNARCCFLQLQQHERWSAAQGQWLLAMRGELTGLFVCLCCCCCYCMIHLLLLLLHRCW